MAIRKLGHAEGNSLRHAHLLYCANEALSHFFFLQFFLKMAPRVLTVQDQCSEPIFVDLKKKLSKISAHRPLAHYLALARRRQYALNECLPLNDHISTTRGPNSIIFFQKNPHCL